MKLYQRGKEILGSISQSKFTAPKALVGVTFLVFGWWYLTLLWPKAKAQTFSAALLFPIYPIFIQQSMAITYKTHYLFLCNYLMAVSLMLLGLRKPRYFVLCMDGMDALNKVKPEYNPTDYKIQVP